MLPFDPLRSSGSHEGAGIDDEFVAMLPAAALVEVTHHEDLGLGEIIFQKFCTVAALMQPACEHVQGAGWGNGGIPCALNQVPPG